MARVSMERMQQREALIIEALYSIPGRFTIATLAQSAGDGKWVEQVRAIVRARVESGVVQVVDDRRPPYVYKLAPDD